jgi:hypothetical protein
MKAPTLILVFTGLTSGVAVVADEPPPNVVILFTDDQGTLGPKRQGFDEFFGIRDGFIDNYNHFFLHGNGFHDLYEGTDEVDVAGEFFPELMVRRSLKFIDDNADRPFFLYVAFNIPHYPEQALRRFETLYENLADPARRSYAANGVNDGWYASMTGNCSAWKANPK